MQATTTNLDYTISTDASEMDVEAIHSMLLRSHWAYERSKEATELAIKHSFCCGAFQGGRQVGFARAVTDFSVIAYICDVFVHEDHRGKGLSRLMMLAIMDDQVLQNIEVWRLRTQSAHGFYQKFGFQIMHESEAQYEMYRRSATRSGVAECSTT